jgi:protein tyrosine/serine phosphatase
MNWIRALCGKCLVLFLLMPTVSGGSYFVYIHGSGNFHPIVEGQAYRSAQLNPIQLVQYIKAYKIRSILNLRGLNIGSAWYEKERWAAEKLHVKLLDYGISANHDVSEADIDALLSIIRNAPKPILIHCKAGADRSGLVAALYLYSMEGNTAEEASKQLSVSYGHIPMWSSTQAMDRTFWRYIAAHTKRMVPSVMSSHEP